MNPLIVTIGLDHELVAKIREKVPGVRFVEYDTAPPNSFSVNGKFRIESPRVMGKFLEPDGVLWYGYYEGAEQVEAKKALALSLTPSFPDVRVTLPHDSRVVSLALATRVEMMVFGRTGRDAATPHGFVPGTASFDARVDTGGPWVAKLSDRHCGEGKERGDGPIFDGTRGGIVEPYFEGASIRVLCFGIEPHLDGTINRPHWVLRYESEDWRKNVRAKVTDVTADFLRDPQGRRVLTRALALQDYLSLQVAGYDFIVPEGPDATPRLLEVNAYPGLEDLPEAQEAFVRAAALWIEQLGLDA